MSNSRLSRLLIPALGVAFAIFESTPVEAQGGFGAKSCCDGAAVYGGIAAAAAIVAVTVYLVVRKPSITGCTETSGSSLVLRTDGGGATYALTGDIAQLKTGERVRVSGKRSKKEHSFSVNKLSKDFGACQPSAASA